MSYFTWDLFWRQTSASVVQVCIKRQWTAFTGKPFANVSTGKCIGVKAGVNDFECWIINRHCNVRLVGVKPTPHACNIYSVGWTHLANNVHWVNVHLYVACKRYKHQCHHKSCLLLAKSTSPNSWNGNEKSFGGLMYLLIPLQIILEGITGVPSDVERQWTILKMENCRLICVPQSIPNFAGIAEVKYY